MKNLIVRSTSAAARAVLIAALLMLLITCENLFRAGFGDKVDIEPPTVSIDSHSDGEFVAGTVTVGGSFGDDREGPTVAISLDGGSSFSSVANADAGGGVWSHALDTREYPDAEREIVVRVTDQADKRTQAKVIVNIDNHKPVVVVRSPQGTLNTNTLFNRLVSISGDAYDSFGITDVTLSIYDAEGNPLYLRRTSDELTAARENGSSRFDMADGTNSWSYPLDTTLYTDPEVGTGVFAIEVTARDRAGNENGRFFYVDALRGSLATVPTINELYRGTKGEGDLASADLSGAELASLELKVDQERDLPRFEFALPSADNRDLGENPKATGAVTDDDGIAPESVELLLDADPEDPNLSDDDWVSVDKVTGSGGRVNWEYDLSALAQGPHSLSVRASDINDRRNVSERLEFAIDYGPPTLVLESPAPGSYHNGDIVLEGRVEDGGGVERVEVSSDGGSSYVDSTSSDAFSLEQVAASGEDGGSGEWRWSYTFDGAEPAADGTVAFRVRAVDIAQKRASETLQVSLDRTEPVLEFLAPGDDNTVNGELLAQGTTEDRSPIASLALYAVAEQDIAADTEPIAELGDPDAGFDPYEGQASSAYRWYKNIDTTTYQQEGQDPLATRFTIVAEDRAGNRGYHELPLTIDQSTDTPVIAMDTPSLSSTAEVFSSSSSLVGTVQDDDGVALATATYDLYEINADGDRTTPALQSGALYPSAATEDTALTRQWSVSLPDAGGEYELEMAVEDEAGKAAEPFSLVFTIDAGPPAINESASGLGDGTSYVSADVPLGGTVTDGFGVDSLVVRYEKDGAAPVTLHEETSSGDSATRSLSWSTTLPVSLGDGAYELILEARDDIGTSARLRRTIVIDTASPVLTVSSPVDGEFVDDASYTIQGQVTDESGRGVDDLEYSSDGGNSWSSVALSGLNWSVEDVNFSSTGEGSKTLMLRAGEVPPAGDSPEPWQAVNPPSTRSVSFFYDEAAPMLIEEGLDPGDPSSARKIRSADFTLSGTASDTNELVGLEITAVKDGTDQGTLLQQSFSGTTNETYGYQETLSGDGGKDGLWEYTLTATDVAGRTSELTRTVLIDETAPPAPSIDPLPGGYQVNELVTSGSADDGAGGATVSGVVAVEYSFDQSNWQSVNGTSNWFGTIDIGPTGADLGEGSQTLYVRARDRAGNISASGSRSFTVDRNDPAVDVDPGYDGTVYRNGAFTISGTIDDSLSLPSTPVTVAVIGPGGDPVDLSGNALSYDAGTSPAPSWSQTVPIGDGDGSYNVTITGTDSVGRTTQLQRSVVVDTTAPSLADISVNDGALLSTADFTVSGTAADGSGSGVAGVEYRLNDGGGWSAWTDATGSSSWNIALNGLSEGLGLSLELRSRDNAGNTGSTVSRSFDVDLAAPALTETASGVASASTAYRNGDISLGGSSSDANGVSSVVVTYRKDGAGAVTLLDDTDGDTSWSTSLSTGLGDGSYEVSVTATDAVGKTASLTRNIVMDTVDPNASYTSIVPVLGQNTVNGKIDVRAAVADDVALDTLEWALVPELPAGDTPADGDYTLVDGSRTSPLFDIDTTAAVDNVFVNASGPYSASLTDEAVSQLWVRAADRAGNAVEVAQDLAVSQASDTPSISFATLDGTATTAADSFKNLIESNGLLRFSVQDDDSVDVSSLEISVGDNSSWETVNHGGDAAPANGVTVSTDHDLYDPTMLAEGTTSFYLRVSDDASEKEGLPATQQSVGPIYLMVDRNFPELTETGLGGDVFRSALFDLSGSVSDTNALASLRISESVDGGPASTVEDTSVSGTSDTWSLADMPSSGSADDGEYLYTITVQDASGKETVVTRTVTIDTTAPAPPAVSTPGSGDWLNNSSFIFSGTASDGSGSGVKTVYYSETARGAGAPAKGDAAWESVSTDGTGNWSASLAIGASGERDFHAYSLDDAGNDGSVTTLPFGLDQASPAVTVTGGSAATAFENGDFSLDGGFTDDSGLASVTVETSVDNSSFSAADPATASFDAGAGTWSWTRSVSSQSDGTYYYRFSFTDLAGNSSQLTKTVNLDRQAPTISFDATSPSINFDTGTQSATANGIMSLSGTVSENQGTGNLQSLAYRLNGGAYTSLPVNAGFSISGIDTTAYPDGSPLTVDLQAIDKNGNAGVETFTLNVDQATDKPQVTISAPSDGETVQQVNVSVSGSIVDDDGVSGDPGTVEYRYSPDDGTTWGSWTDISVTGAETSRSFSFSISSGSDGSKDLEIRATDVAGVTSDTAVVGFIFDTEEPEITGLTPAEDSVFNGDFTVEGTVSDDNGNVDHLQYRVERDGAEIIGWTDIIGPGNGTSSEPFSQLIDTSIGAGDGSGTYEVFLEATDSSGFTRERNVSVLVDKTPPTVSFAAPAAGSTQNNIISISGNTGDLDTAVASVEFRIVDTGGTERTLPTGTVSGTTSWSISGFDTRNATLMSYAEDLGGGVEEVSLRAIVTDDAGNSYSTAGGNDLVFQVDQSSDNPAITFDTVATDGSTTLTNTTIDGTVTDDDGVASIIVDTWDAGSGGTTPDRSEAVTLTRGSLGDDDVDWRIVLDSAGNGLRGIRVRAIDTVDNNGQDYAAGDYSRADTGRIDFQLDTEAPDAAFVTPDANITWSSNNAFDFTGTAGDETGITALAYKVDDNGFSSGTTPIATPYDNWSFTIPQGDLADGAHTVYVQASDSVGNTRIASRQINVDKTAPTIDVTAPANGSDVYGPVTIAGTAADNAGGAGVASIAVGLGKQIDPGDLAGSVWNAVPGTTSWSFDFANINDYANNTYSVNTGDTDEDGVEDAGETWTDLWDFTFYVRAIDAAGEGGAGGNTAYLTSYTVSIDPKQDRPEVDILSPEDGATVGGFVRVFGSAFDGQFVEKVQIAIDANDNGDYSDDTWSEGTLDETDADGVNWYLADGDTSWSANLNEAGEFDPTGGDTTRTISYKVRAWDYKQTLGDGIPGAAVENSVTFNKSFPRFDDMSLTSGQTVGGTVLLTGIVRDESDLDRIIFSNEGPLLDNTVIYDNPDPTGAATPGSTTTTVQTTPNPYGAADISVDLIGTGDVDYDAAFPGSYRISIPIDTEAPGLYLNGAGSMSIKVTAEDVTTPSPFTNQNLISFNVDNVDPSNLSYTGGTEIVGTGAELKGTVEDNGTISGIDRLIVYLTNAAGEIVRLQNGSGSLAGFSETDVLDEGNTTYDDYRMVIDNRLEDGNDGGSAGDGDGIDEFLTIAAGTYNWSGLFDSTLVDDGAVTITYIAEDFADNRTSSTVSAFVANNKPSIDSVVLGTDLDDSGTVEADERTSPITGGYSATGYTARNDRLYVGVNAVGGNGTLRYSVTYGGTEQNATLTDSTLVIDSSGFPESTSADDQSFLIEVFDSTTSDDADKTDELTAAVTVNLSIDNVDEIAPTLSVAPFGQSYNESDEDAAKTAQAVAAYEDNIATSGDTLLGHLEYASDSRYDNGTTDGDGVDDDADLSGRVIFRGKTEDNQIVSRISASIPGYDGGNGAGAAFDIYDRNGAGALSATDWSFAVDGGNYLTDANGNVFNWTFEWDTASHPDLVGRDFSLTFTVEDAAANTATDALSFDVVPYISGVSTDMTGVSDRNIRGATGTYSVQISDSGADTIAVSGFNLNPIADGVRLSSDTDGIDDGDGTTLLGDALTVESVEADYSGVTVRKNGTRSGYLSVVGGSAVDPMPTMNNDNDNLVAYNQEPSSEQDNPTLTDDRYLTFFDVFDTGFVNGYYPEMLMDGEYPVFGYINDSAADDLQFSRGEITGESGLGGTVTSTVYGLIRGLGFQYYALARDDAGIYHQLSSSTFNSMQQYYIYGEYAPDYPGNWGAGYTDNGGATTVYWAGYNGDYANQAGNDAVVMDELDYDPELLVGRYKNPRMIASGDSVSGGTAASVYMAFADAAQTGNTIIFRNVQVGQAPGGGVTTSFNDTGGINMGDLNNVTAGDGTRHVVTTNASSYFDMGRSDDGVVVITYYNEAQSRLELVYSSQADNTTPQALDGADPAQALYWSTPQVISSSFVGSYVSLAVETDGNAGTADPIHIAAHDSSGADLAYIRLDDYQDTTPEEVTVDANLSVGLWTDIAVRSGQPYIGYYNNSQTGTRDSVKLARFLGDAAVDVTPGVDASGEVTGDWEFHTVPANDQPAGGIVQFKRVNIGFDTSGDPVVGYLADDIEYARYMPEIP